MTVATDVVLVGCGMMTPVGLSAREVAASARSRIQRLGEIEARDGRFRRYVVGSVPDDALPDPDPADALLPTRLGRMIRLADAPLEETLKALPKSSGPVPLFLGLPELATTVPIDGADLLGRLARKAPIAAEQSEVFAEGRSAAVVALGAAVERLGRGKVPFCVVGGLDSQVDLYIMATLDMHGRVRHAANPDGFAPSEGAAFLLLSTEIEAQRHKLKPLARVVATARGFEKGHLHAEEPYRGDGLAETFTAAFEAADGLAPIQCVYASFNGERYWAKEFGVAMIRNRARFLADHQMEHPAECFGDLGAAHGATLLALASMAVAGGYRSPPALVYSSSDYGTRAVALLDRVTTDGEEPLNRRR